MKDLGGTSSWKMDWLEYDRFPFLRPGLLSGANYEFQGGYKSTNAKSIIWIWIVILPKDAMSIYASTLPWQTCLLVITLPETNMAKIDAWKMILFFWGL